MQVLPLSPAEIACLTQSLAADVLPGRLTRKLSATLAARLRLPVQAGAVPSVVQGAAGALPVWQIDTALATLWLTRRLGGQRVTGVAPFVPPSLIRSLNAVLAECWLDGATAALPAALAWHLSTGLAQATLAVQLPASTNDMTRWARGVIGHG